MADVSDLSGVTGTAITEAQVLGIIARIDLNIYNLLAGKWDLVDYAEFGLAGHRKDPTKMVEALKGLKSMYQSQLDDLPAEYTSQFDDPAI